VIAIDTNLLIYAHLALSDEHDRAASALRAARGGGGWGFAVPVVAEFWRVVTPGGLSTLAQADSFFAGLYQAGAVCWRPMPGFERRLTAQAVEHGVSGYRIFDLQIALMAWEAGATEIWTHDRDFIQLPGLDVRDPIAD
jgi:predicted nucleic acid-binding protein